MSGTIVTLLNENANNFENIDRKECKIILDSCSIHCPLTSEQCKKFRNTVLPPKHAQFLEKIRNLTVYEDDTWVISYPKCGTTWTQETAWQICNGVDTYSAKANESLRTRFPFLEASSLMPNEIGETRVELVQNMARPRYVKSHLPICFLPNELWTKHPKIVYVARNEKDTAVSYYHHYYNLHTFQGTMDQFFDLFLNGMVEYGSYWDHVEQYCCIRHLPNLKIIKYEYLKHNLRETLLGLCTFFDQQLSDEKLEHLMNHLQFDNMKDNPAVNYQSGPQTPQASEADRSRKTGYTFIRRGETDSYKTEMPREYVQRFEEYSKLRFDGIQHLNS